MTSNNILEGEIETHDKCQIGLNSGVDFCYPCSGICETNDYVNGMTETVVELMLKQIIIDFQSKCQNGETIMVLLLHVNVKIVNYNFDITTAIWSWRLWS